MRGATDIPVIFGRIAGVVIIIIALALGIKISAGEYDPYWIFLSTAVMPLSAGILILVATEIVARLVSPDGDAG